jgi:cytochrome P450
MLQFIYILTFIILPLIGYIFFTYLNNSKVPKGIENIKAYPILHIVVDFLQGLTFIESIGNLINKSHDNLLFRLYFDGKWQLMSGDPDLFRIVLFESQAFDKLTFSKLAPNSLISNALGTNIIFSSYEDWKRIRKVINPVFKKGWNLDVFSSCAEEVFQKLDGKGAFNVDVDDLVQRATVEALGRELMGIRFDAILSEKKHTFISYFNDIIDAGLNPVYHALPFLDQPWSPFRFFAYKKLAFVNEFFSNILQERKEKIKEQQGTEFNDVLSLLLKSSMHDPNGLTDEEVRCNTLAMYLAGQNTTTFTICATLHLLAEHPEIQEKMRQEVFRVFGKEEYINGKFQTPTNDELNKLEYTYAVMQESMRLYPAVSLLTHREAQKDVIYKNHIIPKGTIVYSCIYAMHRNADFFKEPNTFDPSRYLNGGVDTTKFDSNWFTFSKGSRICIGAGYSITWQKILLSNIIRRYRVTPMIKSDYSKPLKTTKSFLLKVDDLKLNFEKLE